MIYCVVSCPPDTYSGYGRRSLDFLKELIRVRPDWDIEILSQRWGSTRRGYLKDHGEWDIIKRIVPKMKKQPDVWIQITVPNEFQPVGKVNIGVTAAMETNLSAMEWIRGCNRMDLVITSSEHGKNSLVQTIWTMNNTGEKVVVNKPVEVLFEGIDLEKFKPVAPNLKFKAPCLKGLKSSWNFLCVGHWLQGDFGEDRKNIGYTIKAFLETFKDLPNGSVVPGLIVKTSRAVTSVLDQKEILNRIYDIQESVQYTKSLPPIYLLHGDLSDDEMNELYNDHRVKAMVSFTKGEGFGRPLAEFAAIGKPILVSGWSGHRDFLDEKYTAYVGGIIEKVHPSAVQPGMILAEASWFKPDSNQVITGYQDVYRSYQNWSTKAVNQMREFRKKFSITAMGDKLDSILNKLNIESRCPTEVQIVTPDLLKLVEEA